LRGNGCTLRPGSVLIADEFSNGEHQFVDAVVQFAGTLALAFVGLAQALVGLFELGCDPVEPAAGLGRQFGNQFLEKDLALGEDADTCY